MAPAIATVDAATVDAALPPHPLEAAWFAVVTRPGERERRTEDPSTS